MPRKRTRKRAADLDLTRDERISQEIVAAKKRGIDAPYQIPRGDLFTVSGLTRPLQPPAGIDQSVVASRDLDFVGTIETEKDSPVHGIVGEILEKHTDVVLAQIDNDIETLSRSPSSSLTQSVSQRLNAVKQLNLNARRTSALSKKLDKVLYGAMKFPKSKLGGTSKG